MLFLVKIKRYLIYKNVDFASLYKYKKNHSNDKKRDELYKFMPNMCQHS